MRVWPSLMMGIIGLTGHVSAVQAQEVSLLKLDALEQRIAAGGDTAFVVNFWATWCGPCVRELPNFERLAKRYKKKKLKVLLVSVDFRSQLEKGVIPFVVQRKLKNEVFLLDEEDQQEYVNRVDTRWSGSIPASLFIKQDKRKFVEQELSYRQLVKTYQTL